MTPAEIAKVRNACQMIAADCERDVQAMDGMPFNGKVVARMLGEHLAMISTLAIAVELMLPGTPTAGGGVDGSDTGGDASHKHAVGRVPLSADDGSHGHDVRRSVPESLPLEGVAGSDLGHPDFPAVARSRAEAIKLGHRETVRDLDALTLAEAERFQAIMGRRP